MSIDLISRSDLRTKMKEAFDTDRSYEELVDEYEQLVENAPAVEPTGKLLDFARWVATEVCDDDFKENADCFAEVACRKLVKLGLVKLNEHTYTLVGGDEE